MSYKALVEAAAGLKGVETYIDLDSADPSVITQLIDANRQALSLARESLGPDCATALRYEASFFDEQCQHMWHLRNLASLFRAEAWLAQLEWKFDAAAQVNIDKLELANAMRRGGLIIDMLAAIAVSGGALESLDQIRVHFDDETRQLVRAALSRLVAERESFEDIVARDRAWERAVDWQERSCDVMSQPRLDPEEFGLTEDEQTEILRNVQTYTDLPTADQRLLNCELDQKVVTHMRRLSVDLNTSTHPRRD